MSKQGRLLADEADRVPIRQRQCAICARAYAGRSLDVVGLGDDSWYLCGRCSPRMLAVLELLAHRQIIAVGDIWAERGRERDDRANSGYAPYFRR